jgi:uncharacterized SAM-binding protein YcdF (DUF218 family)
MKRLLKILKPYLIVTGILFNLSLVWMISDLPFFFDRMLIQSEEPAPGEAIICIAGGITGNNLPLNVGWQRIYTAVQLYFDGYAPKIIFTGGGTSKITEAEVYAEAAHWLGCPKDVMYFDPEPSSTAEHPIHILNNSHFNINRNSPINIVTSTLHSKRTALCFKKGGFTRFRIVTHHTSVKKDPNIVRNLKVSQFESYRPSGKKYNDIFMKFRSRSEYFFRALREMAAIIWYKIKGLA